MTREEIIAAAKEAGAQQRIYKTSPGLDHFLLETEQLERFAAIITKSERGKRGKFADTEFEMVQLRDALTEIAGSKSLTATPTQFYKHLQRLASDTLTSHAKREKAVVIRARGDMK